MRIQSRTGTRHCHSLGEGSGPDRHPPSPDALAVGAVFIYSTSLMNLVIDVRMPHWRFHDQILATGWQS